MFDPLIGVAINATDTRFGRFRPWMVAGAPLLMLAAYMMFMAEPGISSLYMIGWLLVLYAGFSMLTLGHSAWAAALVPEYHERSRVYGWMQAVGVIAIVIVLALPVVLALGWHKTIAQGVQAMGWFIIGVTPITVLLCLLSVGEPKRAETANRITLRDYWTMLARPSLLRVLAADLFLALGPAITAALYLFFFTQALGFTRTQTNGFSLSIFAAGLVGAPTWAVVAKRLGKHNTVRRAAWKHGLHGAGDVRAGFIVSCFTFLIRAMIADISDEVRLDIGKDPRRAALRPHHQHVQGRLGALRHDHLRGARRLRLQPEGRHREHRCMPLDALIGCYVVVPILTMFVGALAMWGLQAGCRPARWHPRRARQSRCGRPRARGPGGRGRRDRQPERIGTGAERENAPQLTAGE